MRPRPFVRIALFLSLFFLPSIATSGVRDERPNLIGGELGGRGLLFTLNYERFLTNDIGLGVGIMAIKTSNEGITVVPLYASFVPGDTHSPYISVGATLLAGGGDFQDWESTWVVTAAAGYQYQSRGGFFVRPFFALLTPTEADAGDEYLLWPGLTIGGSF